MRISDWSSDVCSSDLLGRDRPRRTGGAGHDQDVSGTRSAHPHQAEIGGQAIQPEWAKGLHSTYAIGNDLRRRGRVDDVILAPATHSCNTRTDGIAWIE